MVPPPQQQQPPAVQRQQQQRPPPSSRAPSRPSLHARRPAYGFTVPSLHDDAPLDCRLYHPWDINNGGGVESTSAAGRRQSGRSKKKKKRKKKVAVVAHPYAPLGGSYDDPVVGHAGAEMLGAGWVVGTFNFRRTTSWTGKPELQDYISFVGAVVEYARCLRFPDDEDEDDDGRQHGAASGSSNSSDSGQSPSRSPPPPPAASSSRKDNDDDEPVHLILGGYSYGSLMVTRLPPLADLLARFYACPPPPAGSTAAEILLRARHLADQTNAELAAAAAAAERERAAATADGKQHLRFKQRSSPVTFGGEESDPDVRRRSKDESRRSSRSLDLHHGRERLARAIERTRGWGRGGMPEEEDEQGADGQRQRQRAQSGEGEGAVRLPNCRVAYLLVSPLLLPTSLFIAPALALGSGGPASSSSSSSSSSSFLASLAPAALFAKRGEDGAGSNPHHHHRHGSHGSSQQQQTNDPLLAHPTLAVFGTNDPFTSAKRLANWARKMEAGSAARFAWREVGDAGHFWQERGAMATLRGEVREWLVGLEEGAVGGSVKSVGV